MFLSRNNDAFFCYWRHLANLNLAQRIVIVTALGIAVVFVGDWITARYTVSFGWVAWLSAVRTRL
jgi:hypothetical protein